MLDFLGLPREIRDEIYELCLVREKIEFEEFYVDETPEDWMQDRKPEGLILHVAKPEETPLLVYQGISFVHRVESLTSIDGRCRWDDIFYEGRERSYRIHRGTTDPPCLSIFLTNRLVYQESSIMFYANNCFCFPSRDCELTLDACSGFLTDRPEQALTYINHISLGISFIEWNHPEIIGQSLSSYGVHLPTMKRLHNSLRGTRGPRGLAQLKIFLEAQCPSDRALKHRIRSKSYYRLFNYTFGDIEKSLKNLKDIQIDIVEDSRISDPECNLRLLASDFIGWCSAPELKFSSSTVYIAGKALLHTTLAWSRSKIRRSTLAPAQDAYVDLT